MHKYRPRQSNHLSISLIHRLTRQSNLQSLFQVYQTYSFILQTFPFSVGFRAHFSPTLEAYSCSRH
jgi:hypothetical protein